MKSTEEIEKIGLVKCDFDNECDTCKNPEGKTFAVGYTNDMCGEECDYYICQKCATENYEKLNINNL